MISHVVEMHKSGTHFRHHWIVVLNCRRVWGVCLHASHYPMLNLELKINKLTKTLRFKRVFLHVCNYDPPFSFILLLENLSLTIST